MVELFYIFEENKNEKNDEIKTKNMLLIVFLFRFFYIKNTHFYKHYIYKEVSLYRNQSIFE